MSEGLYGGAPGLLRGGGSARAKTFTASVPLTTGLLTTVSSFGLLAPVTFAKTGGNANLTLASNGQISATAALTAGATQSLTGTATGSDGVVFPFTANLTGAVSVPAAPTVTLTAGNGQISIAWADGSNGGAAITAHTIYVNGVAMLPITSASPYVLTGLSNGTSVNIEVSATNSAGEGAKSAVQSATPSSAPTGVDGFPTSATLLMYGSDASTSSSLIRNRATGQLPPANLFGTARPMDHPYLMNANNNVTRTPSVVGTDGQAKAVRFTYTTGSTPLGSVVQVTVPAGTYTLQCDVKSETGSNCTIRIGGAGSSYLSPDKTATPSWTTISHTFTRATQSTLVLAINGGTAGSPFDVSVDNIALVSGSSPITVNPGVDPSIIVCTEVPGVTKSGQVIQATSATKTMARMALGAPDASRTELSFVAAVQMDPTVAETNTTLFPLINELESVSQELNSNNGVSFGQSSARFQLSGATSTSLGTTYAGAEKAGWCILIATAGSTGTDLWVNKVKVAKSSTAYLGGNFSSLELMGMRNSTAFQFPGKVAMLGMWQRKLTDAEVSAAYDAAVAKITAQGETFTDYNTFLIAEGDSITAGSGDSGRGGYIDRGGRLFTKRLQAVDYAVPGATLNPSPAANANDIGAANRIAAVDAKIAEVLALGKRAIVSVLIGANNVGSIETDTPEAYFARLKAYTDARKALGAKIVVQTMTAGSGFTAGQNTAVAAFNQMLRDGVTAGYFDACVDHASTAMWPWSATYYADGVHPNAAGHTLMASTFQAAVAPLVI